jgi:hypothetical protein
MSDLDKIADPQQDTAGSYGERSSSEDLSSIKRLMLAVLQDALECLAGRAVCTGGSDTSRRLREAAEWVADNNETEVFSFNSVCEVLGVDAAAVRKALIEGRRSGLRISRRSPVMRGSGKLSRTPFRKRSSSAHRTINNRALLDG